MTLPDVFTAAIAGWVIALATVLALIFNAWITSRSQNLHYDWERRTKSLDYSITKDKELGDVRQAVAQAFPEIRTFKRGDRPPELVTVELTIERGAITETQLTRLLGNWENLALAVNQGIADERVGYEMVATTVIRHVRFFEQLIRKRRQNPRYLSNLLLLFERWDRFVHLETAAEHGPDRARVREGIFAEMATSLGDIPDVLGKEISLDTFERFTPKQPEAPHGAAPKAPVRRIVTLIRPSELGEKDSIYGILSWLVQLEPDSEFYVASFELDSNQEVLIGDGGASLHALRIEGPTSLELLGQLDNAPMGTLSRVGLETIDGVFLRLDPPVDFSLTRKLSTRVINASIVNTPVGIEKFGSKATLERYPDLSGGAQSCSSLETLAYLISKWGETVLKPLEGRGGQGIIRTGGGTWYREDSAVPREQLEAELQQRWSRGERHVAMPFSEGVTSEGDRRILIAGGKILGAVERVPKEGMYMANMPFGSTIRVAKVSDGDRKIVDCFLPEMIEDGVTLAGIDTLPDRSGGRWLSELNVVNPGLFRQLDDFQPGALQAAAAAVLDAMKPGVQR